MKFRQTVAVNTPIRILAAALACTTLVATACGDDDDTSKSSSTTTTEKSSKGSDGTAAGAPEVPAECEAADEGAAAEVEEHGKPTVEVPPGTEPVDNIVGTGDAVIEGGTVKVHYVLAKASDGSELESSWEQGQAQQIPLAQVFPGFATAMTGMLEGGRRTFTAPAADVFGDQPPPGVAATDQVVFVVDLVAVSEDAGGAEAPTDEAALAAAEERGAPEVKVPDPLPGELTVIDEVVGTGAVVCPGGTVVAHYTGVDASSGETFDSSWESGEPATFPLDGVIPGWTQGLVGMKVGGRRTLVIPGDLAYGEDDEDTKGKPTGDLVFTIDLVGAA